MSYSTPLTAVANATLTAAQWNASVRDNILETAVAKASNAGQIFVATGSNSLEARTVASNTYGGGGTDATNSTTYTNLTGGAAVTVTTGTGAVVCHFSTLTVDTTGSRAYAAYQVSGATTLAAQDSWSLIHDVSGAGRTIKASLVFQHTGMIAGVNTFTQQFKVSANTGTFLSRGLTIFPL